MRKKIIAILSCLCLSCAIGGFAACSDSSYENLLPDDKPYSYQNQDRHAQPDEGIVLDGILDDEIYRGKQAATLYRIDDYGTASVKTSGFVGEKGVYLTFDVEDCMAVYVNPARSPYNNSCIELYWAPSEIPDFGGDNAIKEFEIQLVADGSYNLGQRNWYGSWYGSMLTTYDKNPVLKTTRHGGNINTPECTGYTHEFFIPYEFLEYCGIYEEGYRPDSFQMHYAFISPRDYDGNNHNTDRIRKVMTDNIGSFDGWRPGTWYTVTRDGLAVKKLDVSVTGQGKVTATNGTDFVVPGEYAVLNVEAGQGYKLESLKINGTDRTADLKLRGGKVQLDLFAASGDEEIEAKFIPVSTQTHTLGGKVDFDGFLTGFTVKAFDGVNLYDVTLGQDGTVSATLPAGDYNLVIYSGTGSEICRVEFDLNADNHNVNVSMDNIFAITENGDGVTIDNNDKTVTVGKNAGGTVDEATRKATLSPAFTPDGDKWVFDFTVKELNEKGAGGWRRFGVTLTEQGDGFIFLYNGGNKQVKAAKVTGLDMDVGGQFGGTDIGTLLDGLTAESGVALRAVRNATRILLYVNNNGALTQISELTCEANAATEIGFLGCWNDWQFSDVILNASQGTAVTVTNDSVTGGTVTVTNESVKLYDDVVITVTPDSGYLLESLTVNGAEQSHLLVGNTLTLAAWSEETLTIVARFERKVTAENVTFNLTGATLTDGDTVTVKDRKNNTHPYTVAGGTLVIPEILAGECEVSYNGSPAVKVTVTEHTTAINFTITSGVTVSGDDKFNGNCTVTDSKDGFVTTTNGYWKDSHVNVSLVGEPSAVTTVDMHVRLTNDKVDANSWRSFDIEIAGVTISLVWNQNTGSCKIGDSDMPEWLYEGFVNGYTIQSNSVLMKDGYDFRVVLGSAKVELYAKHDGEWVKLYETACISDATDMKITTGYCGWTVTDIKYGSVSAAVTGSDISAT